MSHKDSVSSEQRITQCVFSSEWKRDNKEYNKGSDIEVNGLRISLKSDRFSLKTLKLNEGYINDDAKNYQHKLDSELVIYRQEVASDFTIFEYENICYLYTMDNFILTFKSRFTMSNDSRTKTEKLNNLKGKVKIKSKPIAKAEIENLKKLALITFEI